MKNYFRVNVSKYVQEKNFDVVRLVSLDNPKVTESEHNIVIEIIRNCFE